MKYIWIIGVFMAATAVAQTGEKELKTSINQVTVYLEGAQVFRGGKITIPAGETTLKIVNLSPYIDDKTIQVRGEGDFTLAGISHQLNYLEKTDADDKIKSLKAQLKELKQHELRLEYRMDILNEKESVLNTNKKLGEGSSITELEQAMVFYDRALSEINAEKMQIGLDAEALKAKTRDIEAQIRQISGKDDDPTGEITLKVIADKSTSASLSISYLVDHARWFPSYDIRVTAIDQPVNFNYQAQIIQNTGTDWENVKLKLSNGNPNKGGTAPELQPWYLGRTYIPVVSRPNFSQVQGIVRDENGEPLPGVNVIIKGTTIGTVTNIDGRYSLAVPPSGGSLVYSFVGFAAEEHPINNEIVNISMMPDKTMLNEVVVTGYANKQKRYITGSVASIDGVPGAAPQIRGVSSLEQSKVIGSTTVVNQTTVEFEVDKPYTVKSNRQSTTVDLKYYKVDAIYEYYAVPKLDSDAFLTARIPNWDQYNFLQGEASLYFEGTFLGRSILDPNATEDTLTVSLGRDRSIVVSREKVDEFSSKRMIGANQIQTRGYQLSVRNKKEQAIRIRLVDQLPVSTRNDITVKPLKKSGGDFNEVVGEVSWDLEIKPGKQEDISLQYEVKHPKNTTVILE